jgi:hypothetical protein
MLRQNQIAQVIDIQEATYKPRHGEIIREQLPFIHWLAKSGQEHTTTSDCQLKEISACDLPELR